MRGSSAKWSGRRIPHAGGDVVTVAFRPELEDQVAAERLYRRNSAWARADRVVALVLLAVGLASTLAVGPRWWTLIWFPLAVLEWFHGLDLGPWAARAAFWGNPKFREPYELGFDDEGIRFRTPTIDSRLAWATYTRVLEDDRVWLLVYGPRMYTVLPKRAFDAGSLQAFRELVTRHVGKGK
jgi:hypothetical protein